MCTESRRGRIERRLRCLLLGVAVSTGAHAHDNVPREAPAGAIVLAGATVHPVASPPIENGRVRFEAGKLVAIGRDVDSAGAEVIDLAGKHIYPGMIAANSVLGLAEIGAVRATLDVSEVGANAANVRAEVAVNPDSELIPVTRSNGVLLALTAPQVGAGGVIAGTSAFLQLEGWTWEQMTLAAPVALHVGWPTRFLPAGLDAEAIAAAHKSAKERRDALQRAFEQARAYSVAERGEEAAVDLRLQAMQPFVAGKRPVFFHVDDVQGIDDALAFAREFGLRPVIVGGAEAWRVTARLKAEGVSVILGGTHVLPLRRGDPVDAIYANASQLAKAGVPFAIATPGDGFDTSNLRNLPYHAATAVAYGLTREQALEAITLSPARILGVDARVGSLEVGKDATLFVTDGDPLDARTQVERAWIGGREIDLANRQTRLYDKYRQKYPQTRTPAR